MKIFKASAITLVIGALSDPIFCYWTYDRNDLIAPLPNFTVTASDHVNDTKRFLIYSQGHAGTLTLGVESDSEKVANSKRVSLVVQFVHSIALATFSDVVGWIYFVAWSISFYPQVITNYRRKSVAGLSFDFLALNITGFLCYTIFNVGLFWIPSIQEEYYSRHPRGVIPVEANDVFFALHAVTLTLIQIIQCFIYETGNQRLFKGTILLLGAIWLATIILLILSATHVLVWLDYLYYFSYVKLGITLIKYIPQVWMNFRRKSTVGWSVGNVLLDFTGGMLSLAQMFIIAYNFDDWSSTLGNPTKIGLGLLSIFFDVIFIIQHYCLYRRRQHDLISSYEEDVVSAPSDDPLIKNV
ncbi:cystinosin-like isoform X2 [Paramacrobiotus metropolitanus]|uniref:cystinosin-like isoform X2 n=1 Tax=Paramacrobiotus metropolitanus TaxID=2943436 RepID=UPI0024464E39|nr:cystinosin-like isoform X2 [Paramacrobiotus metropolitanus]